MYFAGEDIDLLTMKQELPRSRWLMTQVATGIITSNMGIHQP